MDKRTKYRTLIKRILSDYAKLLSQAPYSKLDTEVISDEQSDNYMLIRVGWTEQGHARKPTLYVRIRNDKFWIEEDWTEDGIATDLLEAGVPNEDIVLAFHPPEMRQYTEFAVA
ncbi:MAG: XisI protein [Anaerolineales bacterium]|nr:XisI protein [Anaerolineales bacterium]